MKISPSVLDSTVCSTDIRNVSALEVLRSRALQIDIYSLTYLQCLTVTLSDTVRCPWSLL